MFAAAFTAAAAADDDDDDGDGGVYTDDVDASSSCTLLWKNVFEMLCRLLQSARQDAYIALTSPLVRHWTLVTGMIHH